MSYSATILADSPTSYWRLGEASGTTAADEQAANAGTYVNTPTLGVTGALTGDGNTAATFNGTTQRVLTTVIGTLGSSVVTSSWEWWVKTTTAATVVCFLGTVNTTGNTRVEIFANTSQAIAGEAGSTAFRLQGAAGGSLAGKITYNIYDGNWHHCVLVVESTTTATFYVDGSSRTITYGSQAGLAGTNYTQALILAGRNNRGTVDLFTACSLDEVAVYQTRLTSARVAAHYAASAGAATLTGSSATALTFTETTAGVRKRLGVSATPLSFTETTAGTRKRLGVSAIPLAFTETTTGTRKTFGASATPIIVTETSAGVRKTFGTSAMPVAFIITTSAKLGRFGASATPLTITPTSSGVRKTFGASAAPIVVMPSSSGTRKTFGASATPILFAILAQSSATLGASASVWTFAVATSGRRTTFGTSAIPIVVIPVSSGTRETFGTSAVPISVSESTSAHVGRFGASAVLFTFLPSSSGSRVFSGASATPVVFAVVSIGLTRIPGRPTAGQVARGHRGEIGEEHTGYVARSHGEAVTSP